MVDKTTCSPIATNREKPILAADIDVPDCGGFLNIHWCHKQKNKALWLCDHNVEYHLS